MEKIQDQDRLATLIHQWNQDHYDIFELSKPNEVKTTMKVKVNTNFHTKLTSCVHCMLKFLTA
jgi:hypothetical protein